MLVKVTVNKKAVLLKSPSMHSVNLRMINNLNSSTELYDSSNITHLQDFSYTNYIFKIP